MIEIDSWKRNSWRSSRPWLPCCIILNNPCLPNPSLLKMTDCHCLDTTHIKREWWGHQSFTQKIPIQENVSRLLLPMLSLGADRQQLSPELSADFHSNFSLLLPSLFFPALILSSLLEWKHFPVVLSGPECWCTALISTTAQVQVRSVWPAPSHPPPSFLHPLSTLT